MNFFWTGIMAAGVSYLGNYYVVRSFGLEAVIYFVPFLEETAKTGFAYFFQSSILFTHLVFGIIEAIYDYRTEPEKSLLPALSSILSHAFFGGITSLLEQQTGTIIWGLIGGFVFHAFWNAWILRGGTVK